MPVARKRRSKSTTNVIIGRTENGTPIELQPGEGRRFIIDLRLRPGADGRGCRARIEVHTPDQRLARPRRRRPR